MQEFIVSTLEDENDGDFNTGDLSLREAIATAESGDTITFDSSLSGGTITLALGELFINRSLAINGLGANNLTIDGNDQSRIFYIDDGDDNFLADVSIDGLTITNGFTGFSGSGFFEVSGGGIVNRENLVVTNTTLVRNRAVNVGAIYSTGELRLENSLVTESDGTGPVWNEGGIATIVNSTFANNNIGGIGAIVNTGGGTLNLSNSTLANNSGYDFVLSNSEDSTATVTSTIIANNEGALFPEFSDAGGTFISGGNNIIGNNNGSVGFDDPTDIVGTTDNRLDARLDELQNNGGTTQTLALLRDSPAIDAGSNPNNLATDQRGEEFDRTVGNATDIGAFEVQEVGNGSNELIVSTLEDENDGNFSAGDLSLREAIAIANDREGTDLITIDPSAIDTSIDDSIFINNEEGSLVITDSVSIVAVGENQQRIFGGNGFGFEIAENADVEITNINFFINRINNSGNLSVNDSIFSSANDTAIVSRGTLELQNVLVERSGGEQSGVLIKSGTASIRDSAIVDNGVTFEGISGLIINEGAEVTVSNSTIANNRNFRDGSAAGIINAGSLSVSNSTVANNDGGGGAGGIVNSGEVTITSSIVADNTGEANVGDISGSGEFTSGGFNLVGNGDDVSGFEESDIVGTADNPVNPLLRSLEINGGFTPTLALRELSPAVDNGSNPDDLATDQRGLPRVSGAAIDIGALERQGTVEDENNSPQTIAVSILEDEDDGDISAGDLSLREAIATANSGDTITFNSSLSGETINLSLGELAIDKSLTIEGFGADQLTINADEDSRVFNIDDGNFDNDLDVSIDGITITGSGLSPFGSNSNPLGGGIFTTENLELTNSSVSGNTAGFEGGGIYSSGDRLRIDNSIISGNLARDVRGGLASSFGGGIATVGTTVEITNSSINNNAAATNGGGGLNFRDSQVTISNSTIADNFGSGAGGINLDNSNVNINRSVINGNGTGIFGGSGAIDSDANSVLTIDRSIIDGNSGIDPFDPTPPRGSQAFAAGIGARGTTTITNSTISNSIVERIDDPIPPDEPRASIPQLPTGFGVRNTGNLTVVNSTFSGNPDAGISNEGGTVNISNTTLADGLANVDLTADDNSATVTSTIVVDDSQELEAAIDENSNLIGNSEDLGLGELQDNGGFVPTVALLENSPAINAGSNPNNLATDQRGEGFDRTVGEGTDIGAFEVQIPENEDDGGSEPSNPLLNGDDVINGDNGDNVLLGGEGNNILYGFEGNDRLETGSGNDTLDAGNGDDTLIGGDGDNILFGFDGNDVLETGSGNDTLDAGNGDDTITAGGGNDIITAGSGLDLINAGAGSDTIDGGADADTINAGGGDDLINGNIGNDTLTGGAGNDTLIGGGGDDLLTGDGGGDLFVLDAQGGANSIQDFNPTQDLLGLADEITFDDLTITGSSDAAIAFEGETIGIIANIAASDLTADNFVIYEI